MVFHFRGKQLYPSSQPAFSCEIVINYGGIGLTMIFVVVNVWSTLVFVLATAGNIDRAADQGDTVGVGGSNLGFLCQVSLKRIGRNLNV